ncbi:MAG: ferritin family protein [Candidatus Diapherotrites archaeon]|jgi:rubrerythrin|uniref:Ferritin family protein n=1 Tax=Candidatus Iainarchaeum sp. TaxID=3101447 RepID=A0A8T5GD89_9ARCH|nr:ferritin family protein [Candidatus Diapherotrites archaeon]MBT7240906.1 ferritin family protein [Candidatus Diapherotrites archaeon]
MDLVKAKEILEVIEQLDSNSKESILKALNLAEHVEKTAGEFYKTEVEKTKGNELEAFFTFMVKEEDMHLAKIQELKSQIKNGGEVTKIGFQQNAAPEIHSISAGQEEMTAILYALWREKKAQDFYEKAAARTEGNVRVFFEELAVFERGHVELLEEYVELMQNSNELIMG